MTECVAKCFRDDSLGSPDNQCNADCFITRILGRQACEGEAVAAAVAEELAQEFNKRAAHCGVQIRVGFLPVSVIQSMVSGQWWTLEPRLKGSRKYTKHSSNDGSVSGRNDEIARAFSLFTFVHSKGKMVVVDIQVLTCRKRLNNQYTER